ncbi:MAG: hypothetical protein ACKOEE_06725 [Tagaea sp.]
MRKTLGVLVLSAALAAPAMAQNQSQGLRGPTLDAVRARGQVVCGVNTALPGFSAPDSQGNWRGLDVDMCRAIAAAIFNDPAKPPFVHRSLTPRSSPSAVRGPTLRSKLSPEFPTCLIAL